ncbi:MAG: ATP-binding protein [Acidimicrobiia bacterium]
MTQDEFFDRWGRREGDRLDFKTNADDLHPTIAAMAMSAGGVILIGVRERPEPMTVVGARKPGHTADLVLQAGQRCGVDLTTEVVDVEGASVVVAVVPQVMGRIVTTPDGRLLRRAGTQNLPLTGDQMAAFVMDRRQVSGEMDVVPDTGENDLEVRLLNRVLKLEGRRPATRRNMRNVLAADRYLLDAGSPLTKVALLLFSPQPRRRLPGASVAFARMPRVPGSRQTATRQDIEGDLVTVLEETDRLVYQEMRKQEVVVGLLREEVPEYPRPAVREAIVNALAHRDYALDGAAVDIRMYDGRIEIQSPGGLPGHITVENMRHERFRRNPRLMEALRALRIVEDFGEGIDRMYREMEQRLLGAPRFEATGASVTVTLSNRSSISLEDLLWLDLLPGASRLGPDERRVLVLARSTRQITNGAARRTLGVDRETALRLLARLTDAGLLELQGERGGAHYVLTDAAVRSAGLGDPEAGEHLADVLASELARRGRLTNPDARSLLGIDDTATVRRVLQRLVGRGDAERRGAGRGTYYVPS